MKAEHAEIVIVKRRSSHEDEHHGGAWKIAFADFMTAMMAFFLVLWIISATDKNTKTLIARYFNPVKVEEPAKAQKGIHGIPEKDANPPELGFRRAERRKALLRARGNCGGIGQRGREGEFAELKAINGARLRRSSRNRRRIPRSPIRRCRSRNCSAILAPVSTRSPARRRPGRGSIRLRPSRAMARLGRAPTRRFAIRSVRSAATKRSMSFARPWRSAGGGRRQPRTGAKIAVERSVGARGRKDRSLVRRRLKPPRVKTESPCGVSGRSPGSRRGRGAPSSRRQPACRFKEAAGRARPSRSKARSWMSRRPRKESSSA